MCMFRTRGGRGEESLYVAIFPCMIKTYLTGLFRIWKDEKTCHKIPFAKKGVFKSRDNETFSLYKHFILPWNHKQLQYILTNYNWIISSAAWEEPWVVSVWCKLILNAQVLCNPGVIHTWVINFKEIIPVFIWIICSFS